MYGDSLQVQRDIELMLNNSKKAATLDGIEYGQSTRESGSEPDQNVFPKPCASCGQKDPANSTGQATALLVISRGGKMLGT